MNMTREERIINAAREYTDTVIFASPSTVLHFEAGAKWADQHPKNVWHDASEEPMCKNQQILVYSDDFEYFFTDFPNYLIVKDGGQYKTWETAVLRNKISKWTYINDIFPKETDKLCS